MQELLFGTLGLQVFAYTEQHPWRVFAAVLAAVLLIDVMFRQRSSKGGDLDDPGGLDFGSDGDSGGD